MQNRQVNTTLDEIFAGTNYDRFYDKPEQKKQSDSIFATIFDKCNLFKKTNSGVVYGKMLQNNEIQYKVFYNYKDCRRHSDEMYTIPAELVKTSI